MYSDTMRKTMRNLTTYCIDVHTRYFSCFYDHGHSTYIILYICNMYLCVLCILYKIYAKCNGKMYRYIRYTIMPYTIYIHTIVVLPDFPAVKTHLFFYCFLFFFCWNIKHINNDKCYDFPILNSGHIFYIN